MKRVVLFARAEESWPVIVALVERAPSDDALSYVAAGPLEDFLHRHGEEWVATIEAHARSSRRFVRALVGVWGYEVMGRDVLAMIQRLGLRKMK